MIDRQPIRQQGAFILAAIQNQLEELLPKAKSREKLAGLQGRAGFAKRAGAGITELGPIIIWFVRAAGEG